MDESFLRFAVRLATIRQELGEDAYDDALGYAEIAVARAVMDFAESRATARRPRAKGPAEVLPFGRPPTRPGD